MATKIINSTYYHLKSTLLIVDFFPQLLYMFLRPLSPLLLLFLCCWLLGPLLCYLKLYHAAKGKINGQSIDVRVT